MKRNGVIFTVSMFSGSGTETFSFCVETLESIRCISLFRPQLRRRIIPRNMIWTCTRQGENNNKKTITRTIWISEWAISDKHKEHVQTWTVPFGRCVCIYFICVIVFISLFWNYAQIHSFFSFLCHTKTITIKFVEFTRQKCIISSDVVLVLTFIYRESHRFSLRQKKTH